MCLEDAIHNIIQSGCNNVVLEKFVSKKVMNKKTSNDCKRALVSIFCKHFLNNNIWTLRRVQKMLKEEKKIKANQTICLEVMMLLKSIKDTSNHRDITFQLPNTDPAVTSKLIEFSFHYEPKLSDELADELKDILIGNIYNLFCAINDMVRTTKNYRNVFCIISYLLNSKQRQLFFSSETKCDIEDLLFQYCQDTSRKHCPAYVHEFILGCEDLFYFLKTKRSNKGDPQYAKFIYISFYVMIKCNVVDISYNILGINDFLFTYHQYDYAIKKEIEEDKYNRRVEEDPHTMRTLSVDGFDQNHATSIIKE